MQKFQIAATAFIDAVTVDLAPVEKLLDLLKDRKGESRDTVVAALKKIDPTSVPKTEGDKQDK